MQKKLIALAVAGLSTAAFAQTNVTIYGVADVSGQGYAMSSSGALPQATGKVASGGSFNLTNNSSLIGFKGTEDLGNGLSGLFQMEANVNLTGGSAGNSVNSATNTTFGTMRDSYVGLNSKYGTVLGGYLSTPYRSTLISFDVMPGATGSGRNENMIGAFRLNTQNLGGTTVQSGYLAGSASVRATALAYALPTLYGFTGSLAYTGSANNGQTNGQAGVTGNAVTTATNVTPQGAISANLGWTGYGVNVQGAYQQAKINQADTTIPLNVQGYTSYLLGASYTGVPGLKAAVVYGRNTIGTNGGGYNTATGTSVGAQKGTNNQVWAGVSYRFGNNEPRLSYGHTGNMAGLYGVGQDGGTQWTANWGYYLSKRTQVYGLVSTVANNANGVWTPAGTGTALSPTGGQNFVTYGAGLRTNF